MQTNYLTNTFQGGMNKDVEPAMVPNTAYLEAWNAVMQGDEHFNLTNEHSTALAQEFGGNVVGYIRVPDRNSTIFFVKDSGSSLWFFNHDDNSKQLIIRDTEFGCNWNFDQCEFILGETKRMQPCNELIVYFSSNCFYYRVNVDEVMNPQRRQSLTCADFNLFNCICGPSHKPFVLEGGGKDLLSGAYQFAVQLQDRDGNTTNWFLVGEPVYLGSENNDPNEISDDGIAIQIEGLEKTYTRVNVAVVRTNGGATQSFLITSRTYNSDAVTVEYTSQDQHLEDIPLEEILIKKKTFLKGKRLMQKDGRLFLYQLQQEKNLNYQRLANQIQTKYQVYKVPADQAWRFKQLMRDEVYAFGIVWKFCDGTYSPVFHIPNNVSKPSGSQDSCTDCDVPEWLANSSATRTATFCQQTISNDVDDYCYCPPNAECDMNCNVIIPDEPVGCVDDSDCLGCDVCENGNCVPKQCPSGTVLNPVTCECEEGDVPECLIIYLTPLGLEQFPPCDNFNVTWGVNIDGVFQSGTVNFSFGDSTVPIILPFNISWNNITVEWDDIQGCNYNVNWSFVESSECSDLSEQNIINKGLIDNSCPPGSFCGEGGSPTCSDGTCVSGCSGGGCSGGRAVATLSGAGDTSFNGDIRQTIVHQQSYQKEFCSDSSTFITDDGDILACSDCAGDGPTADTPIAIKKVTNAVEYLRDLLRTDDDVRNSPTLNTSSSVGDAVSKLCGALDNTERQAVKAAELDKNTVPPIILGLGGNTPADCEAEPIYADDGCTIIGYKPALIAEGDMGYWESCELYPLERDCNGEYLYGDLAGTPIRHHKMPDIHEEPLFESTQQGVEHFLEPDNFPYTDTNVFILGAKFDNIQFPTDLPKPLCPEEPYKIVMAKREGNDRSVIGKGILTHTFGGETYGKTYAINKHGVNSWSYVDRHIENGTEENHKGYGWDKPIFAFHSLDVNTFEPFLNPDYLKVEGQLFGTGFKYGNYALGAEPSDAGERQLDRRGVRQSVNLNRWLPVELRDRNFCIKGITYAMENSIVNKASGIDHPIMHKYREKSVYLQTDRALPRLVHRSVPQAADPYIDYSFIGDGVDHPQPINIALAHTVSLKRYNKCQYGNLESLTYVATPLTSKTSSVSGPMGDTHAGMYSFKKSGYVSNKVGDILNVQFANVAGGRILRRDFLGQSPRTVCMPPNRNGANLEEDLGMLDTTELPTTGDTRHPKNMASLHPTRRWNEVFNAGITEVESDVFYPRVITTLIHFWQESEINPKFRQGGDEALREMYYPVLKSSELDSELPNPGGVADSGWLNDFHQRVKRLSKRQLAIRASIRTFVKIGLPGLLAAGLAGTETGLELASTLAVTPALVAGWLVLERYILSTRNLNKLLGIEECLTDEQGAQAKEDIQGFKDNWHRYNLDYSHLNDINAFLNMPANYNTCDCSDCETQPNNEIYYSNKQALDSPVDAYRNFDSNNYLNIPAHAGVLQNLFVRQNRFYAHTTDGIWVLQYSNTAVPSDNGVIILGQGDLLSDPQQIMEAILEGHAGIQHPKTAINTAIGYIFQDEEARKLYIFGEQGLAEINAMDSGMYNWFRKHLPLCNPNACTEIPFTFGVDYENKRILFSNNNWTASYNLALKKWVAFHSYRPNFYFFDRYNFYGVDANKIWKHNQEGYQSFYGKDGEFSVEYAVNQANNRSMFPFAYENSLVDSEASRLGDSPVYNLPITFDKMIGWNTHQCTGELRIDTRDAGGPTNLQAEITPQDGVISWMRRGLSWRYNNITNATVDEAEPIFHFSPCDNTKELNTSNISYNKTWDKTHKMEDRFIIFKYIFSKASDIQLAIKSAFTRIKNTEEHQR